MQAQEEAARWQALRPYLVASPRRGIIGNSKYARRLRSQTIEAAKDPGRCMQFPLLIPNTLKVMPAAGHHPPTMSVPGSHRGRQQAACAGAGARCSSLASRACRRTSWPR